MRLIAIVFLFLFAVGNAIAAGAPLAMNDAFRLTLDKTPGGVIHLHWAMPPGYYLYRQYISAKATDGAAIPLSMAPGVEKNDENFGKSEVYFEKADAELSPVGSSFTLTYQGCQEHGLCYPPARRTIDTATLAVSEQPIFSPPTGRQSDWSEPAAADNAQTVSGTAADASRQQTNGGNIVDRFLARGGVPLLLAAFLGFGILLAFTPCVFPLYPIVAAMLSREGERLDARRGFLLSTSYAVALAGAFAIFGGVAAWTGENLQIALQSPFTVAVVALIFVSLALSMFGVFELQLPSALITKFGRRETAGGSVGSAAALGFSSAFIIGPCVTAPLAGALLYVARTGDTALGAGLLFALGLGKGIPLVVFGTVGAHALPRAGAWMNSVKYVFGFVFLAFGIWMAEPLLAEWMSMPLWAVWAMAVAVFLGAFDLAKGRATPVRMGLQALGLLSAVYAVLLIVGLASGSTDPLRPLGGIGGDRVVAQVDPAKIMLSVGSKAEFASQLESAGATGQPSLVYFTADWCVSCRSIDRNVFSRPEIAQALSSLKTLKVDLTNIDPAQRALMRELDVVGPPTMIFFGRDRQEAANGRLVGEFGAADVLRAVSDARSGS
ncbi:protein-disulfide reductase DsbD (plasmid) [Rhizobium laguerreae]|uniref:protein-disulfide reductase DsbD n=1 Tax=Rhizobium laguerreae TaxID=1076926 RepID=UPI001E58E7FA|nr:protein-disulfide reductase DsbD [Rhizobium laguerreae]UFW66986.1 protein-disulfide reductase DsbD [Rhizobium laguerreae]